MRYTLRNQKKIINAFDEKVFNNIRKSLIIEFKKTKLDIRKIGNDKYDTLMINDDNHTCGLIAFFVISKKYDVYKLAFKEFIN
jgi:hypothetical protein